MAATMQFPHTNPHPTRSSARSHASAPARALRQPTKVYWQRRLAVGVIMVLAGAGLWTVATWATNSSVGVGPVGADRGGPLPEEILVVQPGDTLWSIATELDPEADIRAAVDRLADLNGGSAIEVGQRLIIDQ